jgi:hypothetical protein
VIIASTYGPDLLLIHHLGVHKSRDPAVVLLFST